MNILMTEGELRLFSDWLEEYNKEQQEYLDELESKPGTGYHVVVNARRRKDGSLDRMNTTRSYISAKNAHSRIPEWLVKPKDGHDYHRLSREAQEEAAKAIEETEAIGNTKGYKSQEFQDSARDAYKKISLTTGAVGNESRLAKSGYDDTYSSRFAEKVLGSRLKESHRANKVAMNRREFDKTLERDASGNIVKGNFLDESKRHFKDASIVYDAALDRDLKEDAAKLGLAAAGVTALGFGAYAIKRSRKKKKAAQEEASKRFKKES